MLVDRSVVERAQRGDRDAYEALVRASSRRLFLTAYRIVHDTDLADDATQGALVSMWRELPGLRDPDRFEAWTYRLVVRECLGELRRRRRRGVHLIDAADISELGGEDTTQTDIRDELGRALRSLSVDHRTVIVLHHYVGLPLTEIAEVLGVPVGTVGSRMHHAKRSLRAALDAAERSPIIEGQPA